MRNRISRPLLIAGALGVSTVMFTGCQSKDNHQVWVNDANDRYHDLRSMLMLEMAQQQFDTGDLDLAEGTLRDAMSLDSDNARLHVLAGRIAMERGRLERAYHFFNAAIEFDEQLPEPRYYQGLVMQRWQQFEGAAQRYREAYELEPDNVAYLLAVSEMLVECDQLDEALAMLEGKLAYFDQNAAMRLAIAHLYVMKQQPAEATKYFEQASLLSPDDLKIREHLGLAQLAAGKTDAAISTMEDLLRRDTQAGRDGLKRTLAMAYLKADRKDRARELYLELAREPQAQADDWLKLSELALQADDLFGALSAANQAVRLAPQRHEGYLLAGMVWQRRGNLDEALRMFDRAAELSPQSAAPLILRGISLERAGRRAAAAESYQEALRRTPGDTRAQKLLMNVQ